MFLFSISVCMFCVYVYVFVLLWALLPEINFMDGWMDGWYRPSRTTRLTLSFFLGDWKKRMLRRLLRVD